MILYLKGLKDSTQTLLDLINTFGKIAGYKISIQKQVAFLYTNNEQAEKEIRKAILFIISSKIKYLRINLTKEMKDFYNETYEPLKKETEGDTRRWKDLSGS
jgi:hypothetical protein